MALSRLQLAEAVYQLSNRYKAAELSERVAAYLSLQRRTKELGYILRELERLRFVRDGIVEARVVSAYQLTEENRQQIKQLIADEYYGKQLKIILHEHLDAKQLSGVRVTALGKELDSTAFTQLLTLKSVA
jgi:F0F1-type ATP synthase delta subunit